MVGFVGKQKETPINSEPKYSRGILYDIALCSVVIIVKKIVKRDGRISGSA